MKKIRPLLFFFILSVFLFSFTILATTITLEGVEIDSSKLLVPDENWKYSLIYQEESPEELSDGQQIVTLVVKGIASEVGDLIISADTIQYIDQTASTDTKVEFLGFMPKKVPNCTVLLGGIAGGPKIVGYIEAEPVSVSGKVDFISGSVGRVGTVTLYELNQQTEKLTGKEYSADTDTSGSFNLKIPFGAYRFLAEAESHTAYTKTKVLVEDEIDNLKGSLLPGELTGDININFSDLSKLIDDYNKTRLTAKDPICDITDDSNINFTDLSTLIDNFNKAAIIE